MERESGEGDKVRYCVVGGGGRCGDKERGLIFFIVVAVFAGGSLKGYACVNKNIITGGVLCPPVKIVFTYGSIMWSACKNIFSHVDEGLDSSCYLHRRPFGSERSTCLGKNIPTSGKLVFLVVECFQICFASFIV